MNVMRENISLRCGNNGCEFYNKHNKNSGCYRYEDRRECSKSMKHRLSVGNKSKRRKY